MKRMRTILAAALAWALLLWAGPAALAEGESSGKEEVVYINLNASGAAETVDVVNIFDLAQAGRIEDHGDYASVRNMTGTEELELSDGTVTAEAGPGRLYYEGRLENARCPWSISLRYFLDGEEREASELAGTSGALEIRMTVEKDPACEGAFFDNYALQASFTLDAGRCGDIDAPGATVANVGGDKQLTYTILPGMGADVTIRAQVTDFEMEPVAINGVLLALDIQLDDEALSERLSGLTEAVTALDEGAGQLSEGLGALQEQVSGTLALGAEQTADGASKLKSSAGTLKTAGGLMNTGAGSVSTAAGELDAGLTELNGSLAQLSAGLEALDGQSGDLTAGSGQTLAALQSIQQAVTALNAQVGAAAPALGELQAGVDALVEQYTALDTGLQTYTQAVAEAYAGSEAAAAGGTALAEGSGALADGAKQLAGGTEQLLTGIGQLSDGAETLADGAAALSDGVAQLSDGMGQLDTGAAALANGASALSEQTGGLDGELGGEISQLLTGVTGGAGEVTSFVSPENADVTAVQFVLRTPPIQKPAPEVPEPEPEPQLTFWEKLTALF